MAGYQPHRLSHWAALLQRVSGLLLALFLPLHFLALGLALDGPEALDRFLNWTDTPLVKLSEVFLVALLSLHFVGGIRLLMIEFMAWSEIEKTMISIAGGATVFFVVAFLLNVFS